MKKLGILFVAGLLLLASCVKEVPVSVEFSQTSYEMTVGDTLNMSSVLKVTNSVESPVCSSSDEEVASFVSQGKLVALAPGEAAIKAAIEGIEANCQVVVSAAKADTIIVKAPTSILAGGNWVSVTAKVPSKGYDNSNLVWEFTPSSAELGFISEAVSPVEHKVKCSEYIKDAVITVKVTDKISGVSQTAVIEVRKDGLPATKISLQCAERLTYGEDVYTVVKAVAFPADYDTENLEWTFTPSSPDLEIKFERISGSEYHFSFLSYVGGGYVDILVEDGFSEVFNQARIKVLDRTSGGVSELTLSPSDLKLFLFSESFPVKLEVVTSPQNYDTHLISWTSLDDKVATMDNNGVLTLVGAGKTKIKVKELISKKESECEIEVVKPVLGVDIQYIQLSDLNVSMKVGDGAVQLKADCYATYDGANPSGLIADFADLEWTGGMMEGQNGEVEVVEVSEQGILYAKNPGMTNVKVVSKRNRAISAICNVTVAAANVDVESVRFLHEYENLQIGKTLQLSTVIEPEAADNKALTYKSLNPEIATVSATGVVTAVSKGIAGITATAVNGISATCRINAVKDIAFENLEMNLLRGAEQEMSLVYYSESAEGKSVTWSSSNENVATVKNGVVSAHNEGTAVIKAVIDGDYAECYISVSKDPVQFNIIIESEDHTTVQEKGLMQEHSMVLSASYTRQDGKAYYPASTQWISSRPSVASVDQNGQVTALIEHIDKYGKDNGEKVTITHIADGREAYYELVVIKAEPVSIELLTMSENGDQTFTLNHGDKFTFKFKVFPAKAAQNVTYICSSGCSRHDFSQIGDGPELTYTANSIGNHEIQVSAQNYSSVKTILYLNVLAVPVESARISKENVSLNVGDQMYLEAEVYPANASYKTVTWTSSSTDVVTVNSNGLLVAKGAGNAVVTGLLEGGKVTVTCNITVSEKISTVKVGDYFYADGTTSSSPNETDRGDVIGVVFSTRNPSLQDSGMSSQWRNGLVISLEEVSSALEDKDALVWQSTSDLQMSAGQWLKNNNVTGYSSLYDLNKECGYTNTRLLKLYNEQNPNNKVQIVERAPEVQLPANTSGWYVPSYAEMLMIVNTAFDKTTRLPVEDTDVYKSLEALSQAKVFPKQYDYSFDRSMQDGPRYWTSTENPNSVSQAAAVHYLYGGNTVAMKTRTYYRVRYIFAF